MNNYIFNRPVNSLRKVHIPSYLGAKIRAEKSSTPLTRITELAIKKRLHSSEDWSYKRFKVFKGINEFDLPEYRELLAPSPITSTAEAYILNQIGTDLRNYRSNRVYSYLATEKGANHNYEYYLNSYERRNQDILTALNENSGHVALFLDIKNFYASIKIECLTPILKMHPILGLPENSFVLDFAFNQIEHSPSGVPIGTELSHVIADAYLDSLDTVLSEKLGNRYFRYVDDLTLVCAPHEVNSYIDLIKKYLDDIGLELNEKKQEMLSLSFWKEAMDTSPIEGVDFHSHCERLGSWINGDPGKLSWLDGALRDQGFQIPLMKISTLRITPDKETLALDEKDLINEAVSLRNKHLGAIETIAENLTKNSTKWYLQKTKRALNPLFYLLNKAEYGTITEAAKANKSLKSQEEVSTAIHRNDCSNILKYPGVAINSFCEIWKVARQASPEITISPQALDDEIKIEAATTLALFEVIQPQKDMMDSPMWNALKPGIFSRSDDLPTFEAEIESLRIGIKPERQRVLLGNRFSSEEDVHLDALELGSQTISP